MPDTPAPGPPNDAPTPGTPPKIWRWLAWVLPLALVVAVLTRPADRDPASPAVELPYTTFYALVDQGQVESVTFRGRELTMKLTSAVDVEGLSSTRARTRLPDQDDRELLPLLRERAVEVVVRDDDPSGWWQVGAAMLPWLLIIGAWILLSRRVGQGLGGGGFGGQFKPGARKFEAVEKVDINFDDVAGVPSAKRDLREVVEFLEHPERFARLGGKLPRGVLLVGSPGTGKTLLARAVAGEAGVPFFSISGSEFIELFVGVGAARVRDLFEAASKAAPAIIFIDEIDAVGRSRGTGLGGGHDEREQTLNQLLAVMDGFETATQVVVIAATNRPDVLDPALLRPGRFDRRVVVDLPEVDAREAILEVHCRDKPLAEDVELREIAAVTPGFSGADLANIVNEAALHALRRDAEAIARVDFLAAEDKVQLGDPRPMSLSLEEKRRVAVHESGHALIAALRTQQPLRRVTIIPRGRALGATQQIPAEDQHLLTQSQLEARICVLLGGYAAEKAVLGESSTGAEDDLRRANAIAHKMAAVYGMSERLGPVYHDHQTEHPFLGARIANDSAVSDATVHEVELEARRLLDEGLKDTQALIDAHRARLDQLVDALYTKETLEREELERLLQAPGAPASESRANDHSEDWDRASLA
jgi:cell division protease FtsH